MFPRLPDRATQSDSLSIALRTIRKQRGLTVRQAAQAMELSLRSYERFEAGRGEIRLERLFRFAAITNCDPLALVACAYLADPNSAIRCADHKLMLIHATAFKRFAADVGDDLKHLDVVTLIGAFTNAYDDLAKILKARRDVASNWLKGDPEPSDNEGQPQEEGDERQAQSAPRGRPGPRTA